MLNTSVLLNTARPLSRFLQKAARTSSRVQVRGISAFPQLLHAKIVIVDGSEAFLMGSPFVNDYLDDSAHIPVDATRPTRELAGRPLHDVSVSLAGAAVAELQNVFAEMWDCSVARDGRADDQTLASPMAESTATTNRVQIVSTIPKRRSAKRREGATEILDCLVAAIRTAEDLIYIEHQYLSSRRIVAELAAALERSRRLQIVMVLNQNPDITAYQRWQNARLSESGLLDHPRTGVFSLWSSARGADHRVSLNQIFVHSKVVTIDDRVAIVGSANLDGVSLDSYGDDFTGRVARRLFRDIRNFDVAAIIRDSRESLSRGSVADLRTRLWAEHLGMSTDNSQRIRWNDSLAAWQELASSNVAALREAPNRGANSPMMKGHVLPYSTEATPLRQLQDLGISADTRGVKLEFNPGWLDVRFSPNWIRNMFL
ncbi:MAG: phospholipase D-like domain-containing protein [Gemmatimonadales bacterium]